MRGSAIALAALLLAVVAASAQPSPVIPYFQDTNDRLEKPDLSDLPRLRFLTTTGFRPFNFLDASGKLAGFHIDLARAICEVLKIAERCQIQALPWDRLNGAIEQGQGEAIIAGLAVTQENRERYAFSRPFLQFPARFVMRKKDKADEPLYRTLGDKRVGVMDSTAHERMLRDLFPALLPVVYTRRSWMLDDLQQGRIAAVFGDGMRLSFWLNDTGSADCCAFVGGPYLASEYLGHGLAIAVAKDKPALAQALDYALRQIEQNGTFAELYLRYFPVSFY